MSTRDRGRIEAETRDEYARIREQFEKSRRAKVRTPLSAARANRLAIDWASYAPHATAAQGLTSFETWYLGDLTRYIDWTTYFFDWLLVSRNPAFLVNAWSAKA